MAEIPSFLETLEHIAQTMQHHHFTHEPELIRKAIAEIARLRAIVSKLPRTADGVPIIPNHTEVFPTNPYTFTDGSKTKYWVHDIGDTDACGYLGLGDYHKVPLSQCYSTRAAAEAALERGRVNP